MRSILKWLVRAYQVLLSPWLGSNCRHQPTCSQYALEALDEWGAWRGVGLIVRRLSKCHPWGTQGHDPVPRRPKTS
ncbi:MAG: membrane protein insertion efficiency factor YidD [Bacteroidetes bacterium]|nr:membrane protein insertion efficiency factor YidD [Bacteroidota bacterium]MDA0904158.1 membrane protein insertion efficiency factor YidD [Bacteroidota bacterium]MDA1242682.1 membrane protein insertion efficiency factor YidD [Bacteroidota bacterium]